MAVKVIEVHLPEYHVKIKPNYLKIGKKVDRVLERSFQNGRYILRAIGSDDHPNLSMGELVKIILETGTDKYDSKRKGVSDEEFSGYDYDIQAGIVEIKNSQIVINKEDKIPSVFGDIIYHFYEHTHLDRGYAVRIVLFLIYDSKKLMRARKFHPKARSVRKGLNKYLYKFKYPENKKDALLGIIKILR